MTPLQPLIAPVRDRLGAELFRKVAGPDGQRRREFVHGSAGTRWFEPGDPIGRVHGDSSMFVGGLRALFLQSLHPAAMQGVADHSGYRGDMWGRLARTANYIAITTFGTEKHALGAIDAVRRAHTVVTGTLPDGTPYAASDPHLLAWVHAAEISSFLAAHDAYGSSPLTGADRDRYVAQAGVAAAHLGVLDPPQTEGALLDLVESYRPELRGTEVATEAFRFLVWHPDLALPARPAYLALVASAVALLPAWARDELGFERWPADGRATRVVGGTATRAIRWAMAPGHAHARQLQEEAARSTQ
ncbi:MAG: oxygenase MpaB family protein [Nocardioides sp.]|uniref:oxygenase MpaB family protein n=1 Tax=Nocardioides sp. TaxID=35761 RepID=UPI003F018D1F